MSYLHIPFAGSILKNDRAAQPKMANKQKVKDHGHGQNAAQKPH